MALPTAFNPLAPDFLADPYPYYALLRDDAPIVYWEAGRAWLVSRYADCVTLLKDARFGHEILKVMTREELGLSPTTNPAYLPLIELQTRWLLLKDPPDHTRLRGLVHKAFTPRMVERLRAQVQAITDGLLDSAQTAGGLDIIADLAVPLPVTVIAEMLGVPLADRDQFRAWSRDLAPTFELTNSREVYLRANQVTVEFSAYLRDLANERRKHPQDDLLTALVEAEDAGDALTEDELVATVILLLFAGHETTVNLIGNGLLALLRHPDQLAKLQAEPSLMKSAVEELLRYDSPVQMTTRSVLEDVEFGGHVFRKGQLIAPLLGAANRDSAQFRDPDTLDITRTDNHHLAFGSGIHYCLGAPLARLEAQIAFETLLRRLPNLQLATALLEYRAAFVLRGLKTLMVNF